MRRGTYSIVAHDPQTGECGVAVQSHWFSVGSVVTWGRAGVGAVATQSFAEPAYGPKVLDRLEAGQGPRAALEAGGAAGGGGPPPPGGGGGARGGGAPPNRPGRHPLP